MPRIMPAENRNAGFDEDRNRVIQASAYRFWCECHKNRRIKKLQAVDDALKFATGDDAQINTAILAAAGTR
jgi:hypothetical protein